MYLLYKYRQNLFVFKHLYTKNAGNFMLSALLTVNELVRLIWTNCRVSNNRINTVDIYCIGAINYC